MKVGRVGGLALHLRLMGNIYTWLENRVVQNLVVWALVFAIAFVVIQADGLSIIGIVLFFSLPIYINNLKIQVFLYRKHKLKWGLLFLLNISLFTIIGGLILGYSAESYSARVFYSAFGFLLLVVAFGGAFKMARDGFIRHQQIKNAELNLLKAQMNPHFLFNTLNNLYGLSVKKSDHLPDLMLRLSNLLRYSLYETHHTVVPLSSEVEYLNNYIELERIRLEKGTEINFHVNDHPLNFKLAPMLLIVFVENAFKYVRVNSKGMKYVTIRIEVVDEALSFVCVNSIKQNSADTNIQEAEGGLGLANTRKRLEFMYPGLYDLKEEFTSDEYSICLKISR